MKKLIIFLILVFGGLYFLGYDAGTGKWDAACVSSVKRVYHLLKTDDLNGYPPLGGQKIGEVNGKLAADIEERQLNWIPLERMPHNLRLAVVAVEDSRFFSHGPLDYKGIMRAVTVDLVEGGYSEGGSTITQQLAKNLFLKEDKTLSRKLEEAFLASRIEGKYSKEDILEMYLNQIYYAPNVFGAGNASKHFFNKPVDKLSLAQAAMLAGVPKNPSRYSPTKNFQGAKKRQEIVLDRMAEVGFITKEESTKAKQEKW